MSNENCTKNSMTQKRQRNVYEKYLSKDFHLFQIMKYKC